MSETKPKSSESRATRIRAALRHLYRDNQVDLPTLLELLDCSEDEAVEKSSLFLDQAIALLECFARGPSSPDSSETDPIALLEGVFMKTTGRSSPSEVLFPAMATPEGHEAVLAFFRRLVDSVSGLGDRLAAKGYPTQEQQNRLPGRIH